VPPTDDDFVARNHFELWMVAASAFAIWAGLVSDKSALIRIIGVVGGILCLLIAAFRVCRDLRAHR